MLGNKAGNRITTYPDRYVVFDLETTGTSTNTDYVIEISAVKVEQGQITQEFSTLVNPGIRIPFWATQVNGITDEMVEESPGIEAVLPQFLDFIGDDVLVGHNIGCFDMKFLYRECNRLWDAIPGNDYIDTLYLARNLLPALKHHRLTDLSEYYGISTRGAHRALNDCLMNQKVYEKLNAELKSTSGAARICPECGKLMKQRNGRFGAFWGCTGFPNCRHTEKI